MEVTRSNFKNNLESIAESISEASFISFDGEFTGLSQGKGINAFDTPEERYLKLKEGATNFLLIQFGLCAFKYDSKKKMYTHRAFNFYIFPRPYKRGAPDFRFLCQVSSLDFLSSQGFDFNKLFAEGLSYMTAAAEKRMKKQIEQKYQENNNQFSPFSSPVTSTNVKTPVTIPPEHEDYIDKLCVNVDLLLESSCETSIDLPSANGFVRMLVYQTVKNKYGKSVSLTTNKDKDDRRMASITITKVSDDRQYADNEEAKLKAELDELDDAVGFTKIIDVISKSRKLVVGHNMLLDILLSLNQFSSPLPDSYEEFKSLARSTYPCLLDTKLMASMNPFKDLISNTALGDLQKQLKNSPFSQPEIIAEKGYKGYSTDCEQLHQAGYDAFITGLCFISMCRYIGSSEDINSTTVLPGSPLLEPYMNKLFLLRVQDVPYLNLAGDEAEAKRDHVLHVTFPKEWKTGDLHQLFSPYGAIFVAWIDDISAFVALKQNPEDAPNVLKNLSHSTAYRIVSYKEHVNSKKSIGKHPLLCTVIPTSDILPDNKRKRSNTTSNISDLNSSYRNIDTIPEEDEPPDEQPAEKKVKMGGDSDANTRAKEKLFDEPVNWDA